jgi:hypothetical protein
MLCVYDVCLCTHHKVKHTSSPMTTAITIDSLLFFLWMPSIKRPKPGTFAVCVWGGSLAELDKEQPLHHQLHHQ